MMDHLVEKTRVCSDSVTLTCLSARITFVPMFCLDRHKGLTSNAVE